MRKFLSEEQQAQIVEQYQSGKGSDTIAKVFDIHPNSVLKVLKRKGVERRLFKRKIEVSEFDAIVELYKAGKSSQDLADVYKVSNTIILRILEKAGCERRDADDTHRKYAIREDYFDSIDTPEKAYILGFIYADGSNGQDYNTIAFDLSTKDADLLYKISDRIYIDNSADRVRHYEREKEHKGELKTFKYSVLNFNSKYMCAALTKLGCEPRKSLTVKFPEWLVDGELRRHFIRGYYDGDGGVYLYPNNKSNVLARVIGTNDFIDDMILILIKELGVHVHIEVLDKGLQRLVISGCRQAQRFLDWMYKDSTIHLDRKYALYQQLLKNNT
jgi:hypothetical protein